MTRLLQLAIAAIVACALLVGGVRFGRAQARQAATEFRNAQPTATAPPAVEMVPVPAGVHLTLSGSGNLRVPEDIQPGTYLITAANAFCYWERVKAFDGRDKSKLASGNASRGNYSQMKVAKTDTGVRLNDCAWTKW